MLRKGLSVTKWLFIDVKLSAFELHWIGGIVVSSYFKAWAIDAAIHKKMFGSGVLTVMISNEEMNDFMKKVKYLEESGLLIKGISQTIKNGAKEQKGGFLGMLLGTLDASLLGNLLTGKGAIATS